MPPTPLSPIRKAWYKWKSLHFPWRKRFLIGLDLQGNTFWEFRNTLNSHKHRMRRIVEYPGTTHYSDIQISPQWHQWLRHTRRDPPSIAEQSQDLVRRENLKVLVAQADARWAAKPSFLDGPKEVRGLEGSALEGGQSISAAHTVQVETEVQREGGWDGDVGSGSAGRLKDARDAAGNDGEDHAKEKPTMQEPDPKKHPFNERPDGTKVKEKKIRDDPWKQHRGAPSETWQPQAWSPGVASKRT